MIESTGSMGRSATYAEELLVAEVTRLRQELSLAEEGLANYAQELEGAKHDIERLVQSVSGEANEVERLKAVAAEFHNIDDVAEIRRLRALLREWLAGCPNPPEWHWSFDLNVRTVHALAGSPPPQAPPHK